MDIIEPIIRASGLLIMIALIIAVFRESFNIFLPFGPRIIVEVTPDMITFDSGKNRVSLRTFVYFKQAERPLVVAIGEEVNANDFYGATRNQIQELIRVNLFCQEPIAANPTDKFLTLQAFMHYGIRKCLSSTPILLSLMFKPKLTVQGIDSLNPFLCGYQRHVFNDAVAGQAQSIVYKDNRLT